MIDCLFIHNIFALQLCVQLGRSLPTVPKVLEVEAASEAEPAPRGVTSSGNGQPSNTTSESMSKSHRELKEFKIERQIIPTYFPLNNPLRALSLLSSEKDVSLHVSFCRVLGACVV